MAVLRAALTAAKTQHSVDRSSVGFDSTVKAESNEMGACSGGASVEDRRLPF